jgi:Cd2+/Zn2+-exporting ATPase
MGCKCCDEHCAHHHDETEKINYKLLVIKIIIAIGALVLGHIFENAKYVSLIITVIGYIVVGYDIFFEALKEVKHGEIFSEYLLMIIATVGAFFIGEYHESIMVMLLFIIGELLQGKAVERSRKSIVKLVGINKNKSYLKRNDEIIEIDSKELKIGDIIILKKGDMLTVDGRICKGNGYIDDSNLTGESIPRLVKEGSELSSGVINNGEVLEIEVLREYKDSKINKILSLVEDASDRKSKSDKIIRKIARVYTPIVIGIAFLIVLGSLVFEIGNLKNSVYTALTFLLISCPCAIIISVPITYFAAIGGASKKGVLIKGANFLDTLYRVKNIAFDKTGTLSEGRFSVSEVKIDESNIKYLLLAQNNSNHPISLSIQTYFKNYKINNKNIDKCEEIAGKGMLVVLNDGSKIYAGNKKLMDSNNIECDDVCGTVVYLAKDNNYLGYVLVEDKIKESSYKAMKILGKYNKIMLSGDNDEVCKKVSKELGIDEYYANLLPEEKMKKLEEIIKKGQTMFVGDGVNDTLSISLADVSVAMGIKGSDASIEYSDIVIENDNLENINVAFMFASKVRKIILMNLIGIMSLKIIFMILSVFGYVNMWLAIFSDVGLCILSIINSMRASKIKN